MAEQRALTRIPKPQSLSHDFKNASFFGNYQQMKAATYVRNLHRNASPQVIKQSAKTHLRENLFLNNHTDLDV